MQSMTIIFNKLKKFTLAITASLTITACTTPVTPDFADMSANYANILEQYQLNSILINIIRASNERPLSFLDIPSINGSGNVSTSPSISGSMNGFVSGLPGGIAGLTSINPSLSLSFGNSFNFSQSSLDNATFLHGFLSPITIETAKFFISDNLPRELMFSLVVSSIEIKHADGKNEVYINNPLLPEYPKFQDQLYKLLSYGLTIEQVQEKMPREGGAMPPIPRMPKVPQIPSPIGYPGMAGMNGFGGGMYGGFGGMSGFGPTQPQHQYKLCVDKNKFANFVKEEFSQNIFCKAPLSAEDMKSKKAELVLNMRSTNNVFEFLGQVVAAQNQASPYMVALPPSSNTYVRKDGQPNQYSLLVVHKNAGSEKSFASVKSLDGNVYSIPFENNGYSPTVIKIISQLLSLNKIPGSIPSSPGILLR